jgi:hypothetical protein
LIYLRTAFKKAANYLPLFTASNLSYAFILYPSIERITKPKEYKTDLLKNLPPIYF